MTQTENMERTRYLERKVNVLQRLAEISVVLNSTFELEPLLTYLMDAAAAITDTEGASVLLWDDHTHELRFAATTTFQSGLELTGKSVPLQGSLAGTSFLEGRVIQVDDAINDPRHYNKLDEEKQFETRSLLIVPMLLNDKVIGVLEVVNKRSLPWTEDDRDHLGVLTAQAAVAIGTMRMVSALQKANQELSELDKLKNDFIAIASHELRTPLAVILGYASFLKDETQGKLSQHAEKVMESGLQLRYIIENLMNLRYLQQNAAELRFEDTSLSMIISEAVEDVRNLADASGQALTINRLEGVTVHVDSIRTAMALTNVLNNAVRFTQPGGAIQLDSEMHDNEVWIKISDNGIGLEADKLERIFEKFYQVEDHMTRVHGGLGIGLSISKVLVEAQGGRIWAESPGLGQGSSFTLTLPLANVTQQ
ncbi:MAG: GAF domain-containing sensor histidine kinase [Anaerolineae bacterium]